MLCFIVMHVPALLDFIYKWIVLKALTVPPSSESLCYCPCVGEGSGSLGAGGNANGSRGGNCSIRNRVTGGRVDEG